MLIPERRERLSRFLALLLRHQGPQVGLKFDERGFTPTAALIQYIARNELFHWVQTEHIVEVVQGDAKARYEIAGELVRAKYGHSFPVKAPSDPVEPPEILYFAVPERRADAARQSGLKPTGRAMLHLSTDFQEALEVGGHQGPQPVLFEIDARGAQKNGIIFFKATERIYLAASIPGAFLRMRG